MFPTLIALSAMFVAGTAGGAAVSALALSAAVLLGVGMTFLASALLSRTVLRGVPSAFTLELPPFRRPQVLAVLRRSVLERTLFVLGRAVMIAAPAGLVIWLTANVTVGSASLLAHCTGFLDPVGRVFGMDGVILAAFLLCLPANEIMLPLAVMAYTCAGSMTEIGSLASVRALLVENGWTIRTAVCTMLFMLLHWPCSTTLITIRKETGGWKWTLLSALLPTAFGLLCCLAANVVLGLLGL